MCTGAEIAILTATGAGIAQSQVAQNRAQKPSRPQEAKKPDGGLSESDRRAKLLAQLAAGAARNNPTGGLAGNNNIGRVLLGG